MLKMKLQITDSKLGTVTCSILQYPPTLQPTLSEFLAQGDLITKMNTNIFVFYFLFLILLLWFLYSFLLKFLSIKTPDDLGTGR